MTRYLVSVPHARPQVVEAKSQLAAAEAAWTNDEDSPELTVFTLATGSPVTVFRRRTETVTKVEREVME